MENQIAAARPLPATLSVVIIALNEEQSLGACLESVAWATERIVLDGGSTDRTREVAAAHGARVEVAADWQGFGVQKNRALALATGQWVLSLDADEQVSAALRDEILQFLGNPATQVARMPRSSRYCGRYLRHGGWWPDYVTRLFKRGAARFSDDRVHERLVHEGALTTFASPLLHDTYANLEEAFAKANQYSTLGAQQAFERGERASLSQAMGHGFWAFFRTLILRRGFLDGGHGWLLATSNAQATFLRYAKLWLLGRKSS
jgi:glycosyltransferase involved in cell wall biosynthesis